MYELIQLLLRSERTGFAIGTAQMTFGIYLFDEFFILQNSKHTFYGTFIDSQMQGYVFDAQNISNFKKLFYFSEHIYLTITCFAVSRGTIKRESPIAMTILLSSLSFL